MTHKTILGLLLVLNAVLIFISGYYYGKRKQRREDLKRLYELRDVLLGVNERVTRLSQQPRDPQPDYIDRQ